MSSSIYRVAHQTRMQEETASAVFGLLTEDPSLPYSAPHVYSLFKKPLKHVKRQNSSDDDVQKDLKLKAKYAREESMYHRREMEERRRKEEQRMKEWRMEQKKLEEMEGKGRKIVRIVVQDQKKMVVEESEDKNWTAYLRKNLEEVKKEKKLQKQEIKRVKRRRTCHQKPKQKKNVRKEMEKKFNLEFYRYDNWRSSSSSTPKYNPNPLINVMDTPVECTRFEDLILSESDEDVAKEVRFEDIVLSETEDEDDVFETPRRPATHFSSTIYTPESPTFSTPINSKSCGRVSESFPALLTPIRY